MAQRPTGEYKRERPRKQATRRTQGTVQSRPTDEARRAGTPARHARDPKPQRGGKGIVVVIVLLLVALVVGIVLFLTQCGPKQGNTEPANNTEASTNQSADSTAASSSSQDSDSGSAVDKSSWELTLVNKTHPIPEDWEVDLEEVSEGKYVDARIAKQFKQMIDDCIAAGYDDVYVNQAYRSHEDQQAIWDQFMEENLAQGNSEKEAERLTGESVAVPGTSEHELGLAADICSINFDEEYNAPIQTWLRENGHKYGFIQRYPEGKEDITGTKNENWHFRYVGVEAATEMYESGQVLEEYLGQVDK